MLTPGSTYTDYVNKEKRQIFNCVTRKHKTVITYETMFYIVLSKDTPTAQLAEELEVSCATIRRVKMAGLEITDRVGKTLQRT
jgi:hypothetical protein